MSKTYNILKGTDPECVAIYLDENGVAQTLPPYYFREVLGVPATFKNENDRHPVFLKGDGWILHEDGAAFEMSIRPSHNARELFDMIQDCVLVANQKILSQFPDDCLPLLRFMPTVGFQVSRWLNMGKDFDYSTRFGCDPDMDAFDFNRISEEIDARLHPERYTGGHIHLSGHPRFSVDPILAVQCQALTTGCAAIAYSDSPELDKARTFMYGKPGKYRVQNYGPDNPFGRDYQIGIEYRTPSSRWASSWEIAEHVFQWAEIGVDIFDSGLGQELLPELAQPAMDAILSADQDTARQILSVVSSRI